jgi:hypothetical protein
VSEREVILRVGAEGGSVTLHGVRTEDGWRFQRSVVDQTPWMLDEAEIRHDSQFTSSWDEALALLDRYPWQRLFPIRVHPEFRQVVWSAVQTRYAGNNAENDLEWWRDRCGIGA